ncbi:hypothetical protein HHI36_023374 [Cryptolaemus montrouzieri]|uniref:Pseudouridine synthase RsuA/RluA-like domain-containing protein n=1 Tax=Cryptolaemus montrouzieri TaxID=559131 RepID=A0ABD2PGD4_9CUCU
MIATTALVFCLIKEFLGPKHVSKILKVTENFIAVDKTYDLKINSNDQNELTLQTFLKHKFPKLPRGNLHHEFYFVHRLDYSTSGVMCIPLNKITCKAVALAFQERYTEKYYIAIVRGWLSIDCLEINSPIGEDTRDTEIHKMCCDKNFYINPKKARTFMIVLEKGIFKDYPATKILIRPITGRRHQIRVHCNYLGHTIVGDYTYSNRKDVEPYRTYLHSLRLVIPSNIDHFEVQTEDPFLHDEQWYSISVVNELNCDIFEKFKVWKDCTKVPIFN